MAGEVTQIIGWGVRTESQYTPGSAARVVGGALVALQYRVGTLRIAGTVKRDATLQIPSARRVVLMERDSLRVVRGGYSNADGTYAFEKIDAYPAGYIVMAVDQTGQYNADVADNIQAGA